MSPLDRLTWRFFICSVEQIIRTVSGSGLPLHLTNISSSITFCHFMILAGFCIFLIFAGDVGIDVVATVVTASFRFKLGLSAWLSRKHCLAVLLLKNSFIFIHITLPIPLGNNGGGRFNMSVGCDFDRPIYYFGER